MSASTFHVIVSEKKNRADIFLTMLAALKSFRLTFTIMTCVLGTLINSSLVTMYLKKRQPRSTSTVYYTILYSIGLVNLALQICLGLDSILDSFQISSSFGDSSFLVMFTLQATLFYASAWNTAWLSMFYYSRLVNVSHPYLLRMKTIFLSSVPQLIAGSVLSSFVINLPFLWLTRVKAIQNISVTTPLSGYEVTTHPGFTIFSSLVGFILPLAVTCFCISHCVTTLLRHICRISVGESQLTSSQLQGHIRASRTMVMRVILDLTFYLIILTGFLTSFHLPVTYLICFWMSGNLYPTAQSAILIHGNPKLKSKICGRCASR